MPACVRDSFTWDIAELVKVPRKDVVRALLVLHGCRYGMKHPDNGKLLPKGWGFFATHPGIRRLLAKTCNHPPEQQCPIEGKITANTAEYPKALCRQFVLGLWDRRADFAEL